ncbi:MAG: hypothetical protein M5R36_06810 [Deltaproteobacteria bacterium]|nr:hypothetical protein [Deltaproteobacteria bacterium]
MHLFEGGVLPGGEPEGMQSLTIDAYPDGGEHEFELYSEKGPGGLLTLGTANGGVEMTASASTRAFAFRIFGEEKPSSVTSESDGELSEVADVDALAAADTGWTYADGVLWIKPGTALRGLRVTAIP